MNTNWDSNVWHETLNKTQLYFRNRMLGDDCDRELIEAWRVFYQTHAPIIARLVTEQGAAEERREEYARRVWLGLLTGFPKLPSPLNHDSFLYWLSQLVRSVVRRPEHPIDHGSHGSHCRPSLAPQPGPSDAEQLDEVRSDAVKAEREQAAARKLNSRLFQLRIVDEHSASHVARELGLTVAEVHRREHELLNKVFTILVKLDLGC